MAIYHASVQAMSRGRGQSGAAAAAYRAGVRIEDPHTGRVHDYRRRHGVEHATMLAPKDAPEWAKDVAAVWSKSEAAETRKNARVAREVVVALPHELTAAQRHALALEIGQRAVDRWQVGALVAEHGPDAKGDQRNHHLHLLLTPRVIGSEGFGDRAMKEFDGRQGVGQEAVRAWRADIADTINRHLRRAGVAARVDSRSLADQAREALAQGDEARAVMLARTPTQHEGKTNTAARRRGVLLDRAAANNRARAANIVDLRQWQAAHPRTATAARTPASAGATAKAPERAAPGRTAGAPAKTAGRVGGGAAPRGGVSTPVRAGGGGRVSATKAGAGASREQRAEAARGAEEAALVNAGLAAAAATDAEALAALLAALRKAAPATGFAVAKVAEAVASRSTEDSTRVLRVVRAEVAAVRAQQEVRGRIEAHRRAERRRQAWRDSEWRRSDRYETWKVREPRPGVLRPLARRAWDGKAATFQAAIAQAQRGAEREGRGVLDSVDLARLERAAQKADADRLAAEEERSRVLGLPSAMRTFQQRRSDAIEAAARSTDHSLDPDPAPRLAPRLAAAVGAAPAGPKAEEERQRRRRRRRPGGQATGQA